MLIKPGPNNCMRNHSLYCRIIQPTTTL